MFFTRVVEIDDMILPPKPSHPREIPRFGQPSFNVPAPPEMLNRRKKSVGRASDTLTGKRRRDEHDDYESDEAEVHGLVRVTVVTRRKKIKVFHVPKSGGHVPRSGGISGFAAAREVIGNIPTSSRAKAMHPSSSPPLQVDSTDTEQDQAHPPPMPGLGEAGGGDVSSWLGMNDYSFFPYQSLMARRKAERDVRKAAWDAEDAIRDALVIDIGAGLEYGDSINTDAGDSDSDSHEIPDVGDSDSEVQENFLSEGSPPLNRRKSA